MAKILALFGILVAVHMTVNGAPSERIIGGEQAQPGQFPYMVSLRFLNSDNNLAHTCGGSIISNKTILTAAHCLFSILDYTVYVGSNHLDGNGTYYEVENVMRHPNFSIIHTLRHDIGVVHLKKAIEFTPLVQPIQLDSGNIGGGILVRTSGWGLTSNDENKPPNSLQYIDLLTVDQEVCRELVDSEELPHHTHFCTLTTYGEGVCDGDSGSPIVRGGKQIGVVSWSGLKCARGVPDGAARVSTDIEWIQSVTK